MVGKCSFEGIWSKKPPKTTHRDKPDRQRTWEAAVGTNPPVTSVGEDVWSQRMFVLSVEIIRKGRRQTQRHKT